MFYCWNTLLILFSILTSIFTFVFRRNQLFGQILKRKRSVDYHRHFPFYFIIFFYLFIYLFCFADDIYEI